MNRKTFAQQTAILGPGNAFLGETKKRKVRESAIEAYLVKRVRENGGEAFKFVSPGCRNVPDRIVVNRLGRVFFVELKAPGKKLRGGQQRLMKRLRELLADTRCFNSKQDIDEFIDLHF